MNRIVVSPKAVSLAHVLRALVAETPWWLKQSDWPVLEMRQDNAHLMADAGLTRDTLFRACVELKELGVLEDFTRPTDGTRTLQVCAHHWLFGALAQNAVGQAAKA